MAQSQLVISIPGAATSILGSYIPQHAIGRYDPAHSLHPVIGVDGSFGVDEHCSEWVIQRHVIREQGVVLAGPGPETLIDPISAIDLRLAVLRLLKEWWMPQLRNPFRLYSSEYQAYAILTMSGTLHTRIWHHRLEITGSTVDAEDPWGGGSS